MKIQTAKRMAILQEWASQINARRQSGRTVRQWCEEQGISIKTYYHRMKRVQEDLLEALESSSGSWMPGTDGADIYRTPAEPVLPGRYEGNTPIKTGKPVFAALSVPQGRAVAVTVRIGGYAVDIHSSADDRQVEQVLRAVARL